MATDYKEITKLIKLISDSNLSEFKLKDGDIELSIRTDKYVRKAKDSGNSQQFVPVQATQPNVVSTPQAPSVQEKPAASTVKADTSAPAASNNEDDNSNYIAIKSPIVGTFYRSPAPDKPAFAKVGDKINEGDVVCIVEAMKLFNEIESEVSGTIVKVMVEDATPVEYDQVLFLVDPNA